jgi:hypothetical protein
VEDKPRSIHPGPMDGFTACPASAHSNKAKEMKVKTEKIYSARSASFLRQHSQIPRRCQLQQPIFNLIRQRL